MSSLDLQFIGTGNAFAPGGLCWNGFVANGRVLFEAPPQALQALNALKIDPNELDAVVLSHHHGDHFLGLPFLLLHWKYFNRTRPVTVVGPPGTEALARQIARSVYPGVLDSGADIRWLEVAGGQSFSLDGTAFETFEMAHDDRLSASLGFLASFGGQRLGYTGDSSMCDAVLDLARGSDVLVSECASRDEDLNVHMNLRDDMPVVRKAMRSDASLVLTHLGPGVDGAGLQGTTVAQDLERYRF